MEIDKKYRTIYWVSYIILFSYLLVLSIGNFDLGKYSDYSSYFIVIPFLGHCIVTIVTEILTRKMYKSVNKDKKEKEKYDAANVIFNT